jgi:8-oxo-dGTP pyrophosphatase MutT (NUDIX family)
MRPLLHVAKTLHHVTGSEFDEFKLDHNKRQNTKQPLLGQGVYLTSANMVSSYKRAVKNNLLAEGLKHDPNVLDVNVVSGAKLYELTPTEVLHIKRNMRSTINGLSLGEDLKGQLLKLGYKGVGYEAPDDSGFEVEELVIFNPEDVTIVGRESNQHKATAWVVVYDTTSAQVLILKRAATTNNPNVWNFPGGQVDSGSIANNAARELREESGILYAGSKLEPITSIQDLKASYFLAVVHDKPHVTLDHESSDYEWLTLDRLQHMAAANLHKKTNALLHGAPLQALLSKIQAIAKP